VQPVQLKRTGLTFVRVASRVPTRFYLLQHAYVTYIIEWSVLEQVGACWSMLEHVGACWSIPTRTNL